VVQWLLKTPSVSGLFNVGTGQARSFREMITAMFAALGRAPNIEYVDMPVSIRDQYQYFTQASAENLRRAGYNGGFQPREDTVARYVTRYLDRTDRYR
jgi:ADP-L-glycero-D-manno-heptose 6-epimerase